MNKYYISINGMSNEITREEIEKFLERMSIDDFEYFKILVKNEEKRREAVGKEIRYYVNISYEGKLVEMYKREHIKDNAHVNFACWDRSGYGGVYGVSNKSMEHAERLARKCFEIGYGCVNDSHLENNN